MGLDMRNPVFGGGGGGGCANNTGTDQPVHAQSDQRLCYSLFGNIICKLATGELSIF